MDAVGTLTACTMNVIPNKAMMTVTTADSKYSRMTLRGGPADSVSTCASRSRPFDRTDREVKALGFPVVFSSVAMAGSFIADIVEVSKRRGQAGFGSGSVQEFELQLAPAISNLKVEL